MTLGIRNNHATIAEGEKPALDQAVTLIESIKGEPPLEPMKSLCTNCLPTAASTTKSPGKQFEEIESKHCMFQSKAEEDLPSFFVKKRG